MTALTGCGGTGEDPALASDTDAGPPPVAPPKVNTSGGAGTPTPTTTTSPTTTTTTATATSAPWNVVDSRALALPAGGSFDLAATLPSGVAPGGVFDVDPSGAPLPAGITLLPTGVLTASNSAIGATAGVIFRYTPPA